MLREGRRKYPLCLGKLVRLRKERKERKRKGHKEKKKEKGKRGRERGRMSAGSSSVHRRSDNQNSLNQGVKSVYATRAHLQEVEILLTLVYFPS